MGFLEELAALEPEDGVFAVPEEEREEIEKKLAEQKKKQAKTDKK